MSNGFQFFEGTTSENTQPRITVRKGGQMVLTRGTVKMLGEGVTHVQIGYNPKTQVVGIRAVAEDTKGSYRLRLQGTNGLHLVTGKRFFAHNKIETDKARSFDAEKIDEGLVGFSLAGDGAEQSGDQPTEGESDSKPATKTARRQPTEATA